MHPLVRDDLVVEGAVARQRPEQGDADAPLSSAFLMAVPSDWETIRAGMVIAPVPDMVMTPRCCWR